MLLIAPSRPGAGWKDAKSDCMRLRKWIPKRVAKIADGVSSLVNDLHLNITVRTLPMTARVAQAVAASSRGKRLLQRTVNFDTLCRQLIATRDGRYAEVIIAPGMIDGANDTAGMSYFNYGVVLLNDQVACRFIARHETGHLLGYHLHDNWPITILGYPTYTPHWGRFVREGNLMMPVPQGNDLSPRAHDALISFWQGLEQRTGKRYFTAD